jgi:hypothetical protein
MQQVNLYTDAFKPPKVSLPLEQIIVISLIVLFVLVGASFGLSSYLSKQKEVLSSLQKKDIEMTERLANLNKKAEKLRQDDSLIAANQRLNKMFIARQNMISTLDRVVLKESEGFSQSLVALARQKEDGLWLSSILLGGGHNRMILEGVTTKAELVPKYLQKLRQEPSFLGKNFALFELTENEVHDTWLTFTLKAEDSNESQTIDLQPMVQEMGMVQKSNSVMIDSLENVSNEP